MPGARPPPASQRPISHHSIRRFLHNHQARSDDFYYSRQSPRAIVAWAAVKIFLRIFQDRRMEEDKAPTSKKRWEDCASSRPDRGSRRNGVPLYHLRQRARFASVLQRPVRSRRVRSMIISRLRRRGTDREDDAEPSCRDSVGCSCARSTGCGSHVDAAVTSARLPAGGGGSSLVTGLPSRARLRRTNAAPKICAVVG